MSEVERIKKLRKEFEIIERSMRSALSLLREIELNSEKSYENVPGIVGTFDGFEMIGEDNRRYDVPPNYAAKSLLVYGDKLKRIEDAGKVLFKQVLKVPRKKVAGVINKKEGRWHVITEDGAFRISERSAEFNKIQINDNVFVILPQNLAGVTFAALESVQNIKPVQSEPQPQPQPRAAEKKVEREVKPKAIQKEPPKAEATVSSITSDDDDLR